MSPVPHPDTVYLHYSSLALQVRVASPLQLLIMFFFFCFSSLPQPGLLSPCTLFLLCFCNEKFGRSHLFSGSFAQTVSWEEEEGGDSCFCLVYKWQRYYSHKGSVSYHSFVPSAPLLLSSAPSLPALFFSLLTLGWKYALILEFKACMAVPGRCVCLKLINDRSRLGVVLWRPASQVVHVNEQEGEHTARRWSSATRRLTTAAHSLRRVHSLLSSSHVVNLPHLSILSEYPVVGCHENKKPAALQGLEYLKRKLKLSSAPVRPPLRVSLKPDICFCSPVPLFINRISTGLYYFVPACVKRLKKRKGCKKVREVDVFLLSSPPPGITSALRRNHWTPKTTKGPSPW